MKTDVEQLNYIYQDSQIGTDSLTQLIDMNDNEEFKEHLSEYIQEYIKINDAAKDLLLIKGYEEKELSTIKEITSYLITSIKTLTDKSSSNMARIIIEALNKSIINKSERINRYGTSIDNDIMKLLEKFIKFEERIIKELIKFI